MCLATHLWPALKADMAEIQAELRGQLEPGLVRENEQLHGKCAALRVLLSQATMNFEILRHDARVGIWHQAW
jgi:hypothetical protein